MFPRQRDLKVINLPSIKAGFAITDYSHVNDFAKSRKKVLQFQLARLRKKKRKKKTRVISGQAQIILRAQTLTDNVITVAN